MKLGCLVVASILLSACGYENPTEPTTPVNQPTAGVPARIELGAVPGVGQQGGTGTISARVFDAFAAALPNQTVAFSASGGELGEPSAVTDDKGVARTTITGPAGAAITIIAAVGTLEQKAQIAMQAKPDAPPPLVPPVFPPPTPPQPPAPPAPPAPPPPAPNYAVTLSASSAPVAGNPVTLTADVTQIGTAPAPTSYAWECGTGASATTTTSTYAGCAFPTAGTFTAGVTVSNASAGLSKAATTSITIAAPPPPVITVSCNSPTLLAATSCSASATVGSVQLPSSRITKVDWDWGDSSTSTTTTNVGTHTHLAALTYQVVAIVTVSGNPATGTGSIGAVVKP